MVNTSDEEQCALAPPRNPAHSVLTIKKSSFATLFTRSILASEQLNPSRVLHSNLG
jgi:hypothetical protein